MKVCPAAQDGRQAVSRRHAEEALNFFRQVKATHYAAHTDALLTAQ